MMRWRFLDHVRTFEPWAAISGCKAVSLEECWLLKPFGRRGNFPESLVLESCVELVRWLVAASSGFSLTGVLSEVDDFRLESPVGMGELLSVTAAVEHRDEGQLRVECRTDCAGKCVARGKIAVALLPMDEGFDGELVRAKWGELYGEA